ncbi:hypothetical protein ACQEVC_35335 [Plantactinospora sp. CA-294935]|uniref:hypothetical protein n=1 Tax=Plantactinospora sp. CA-294935 TaxID=3240012 RepID=UPI003D8F11F2
MTLSRTTSERRLFRTIGALLAGVVLLVTACQGDPTPPDEPPAPADAAPSAAPTSSAEGCPVPVREPLTGDGGDALRISLYGFTAPSQANDYAFSAESLSRHPELLTRQLGWQGLVDRGAFMVGGGELHFSVTNTGPEPVTIYNARPVNIVRECMPLGLAMLFRSEGGSSLTFRFNLDAAAPRARPMDGRQDGPGFFEKRRIEVGADRKVNLSALFDTADGAYSFDLALEYEVGGVNHVQLVRLGAAPMRIAAALCPTREVRQRLSDEQVARLRGLRYQHVKVRRNNNGVFSVGSVSPEAHAKRCRTL